MADYNIALGVKQPEPVNYLGQMAQVMGIRALQDEMSGSEGVRSAIRGGMSPTDPKLLQYGKRGEAVYKAGLAGEKESLAATESRFGLMGQVFGYVKDNPTLENANAALDKLGQYGVLTPEAVAQSKAQVAADPSKIVTYATQLFNDSIKADKQQADATSRRNTDESNKTRIQAAGISAGPGWAQANLAREKWKDEQQRGEVIEGTGQFIRKDRFGNLTPIDQYGTQFGPNAPIDQRSATILGRNSAAPGSVNAMLTGGAGAAPMLNNLNPAAQAPTAGPTVAAANAAAAQQNRPMPKLTPTEEKMALDKENKAKAKGNIETMIGKLYDAYAGLSKSGGIVDTTKPGMDNLGAGIAASGPGQYVGKMTGSPDQGLRNTVDTTRPLLLAAIKEATGMSAKAMDSNVELQFYLKSATDPSLDIKTNIDALNTLSKMYGLGKELPMPEGAQAPARDKAPAASSAPSVGTVSKGYKFKGGDPASPSSWEKQ